MELNGTEKPDCGCVGVGVTSAPASPDTSGDGVDESDDGRQQAAGHVLGLRGGRRWLDYPAAAVAGGSTELAVQAHLQTYR